MGIQLQIMFLNFSFSSTGDLKFLCLLTLVGVVTFRVVFLIAVCFILQFVLNHYQFFTVLLRQRSLCFPAEESSVKLFCELEGKILFTGVLFDNFPNQFHRRSRTQISLK